MYPARYKSWFPVDSQESDSQSSYASQPIDFDQFSYQFDPSQFPHNDLSLSPIDINAYSLDDVAPAASINSNTPILFSHALPLPIGQTGTRSEAPNTAAIPFSDDSDTLALDSVTLLKSNMPADLMCLFSANLINRRAGTHRWEVECPDCKAWIKTTLPTQILSDLGALGYFNTLSDHRQGKKCLKGLNQADSSPSLSTASSTSSISPHFTPSETSHATDVNVCPGVPIHWPVLGPSFLETFPVG
ncbi:hypothetical protein DEU56DRAFT_920517 [Suillus clintonianus]|uniref:uncharacterized protein n=1 Tax=Suillus clintonianus TaxID=1904413 RepID=UPI001B8814B6|nr:uncharacterized protein DEU56DRAFT_920517 [Suillus clintonianus]KAG2108090.1 hypothetical protein DEU56DRAFT_920517 [Suillus clintonianus]